MVGEGDILPALLGERASREDGEGDILLFLLGERTSREDGGRRTTLIFFYKERL